jgi:hypothetical protein
MIVEPLRLTKSQKSSTRCLLCAADRWCGSPVKEALLEAALESDADVLMIGRSPGSGTHGHLPRC